MDELKRVSLSGDVEGDYVVLERRDGGVLRIAPEPPDGLPKVIALRKTSLACPSQWEGALEDGRTIYARYRHGELTVGVGKDIDEAVRSRRDGQAFYADHVGDALDGFMDVEELRTHLYGLLEFPPDLVVENEREPEWDLGALETLFGRKRDDDAPSS